MPYANIYRINIWQVRITIGKVDMIILTCHHNHLKSRQKDRYVDLKELFVECQIIMFLSGWHILGMNAFLRVTF